MNRNLDTVLAKLAETIAEPPHDGDLLPALRREEIRQQHVVPAHYDGLEIGRRERRLGSRVEGQESVVADLPVPGEVVEGAGGEGSLHRALQQLEEPEAQRVVLFLALVQEVPDVQDDQAVDVGFGLELAFEAVQPIDEDEGIAVRDQLGQRADLLVGPRARRFGILALPAADP